MSSTENETTPQEPSNDSPAGPWAERTTLMTTALCLVTAATAWFLLKEWAAIFRPLLLAVFLCYIIIPGHLFLKRRIPGPASMIALAGVTVGILLLLAILIYGSAVELARDLPGLVERGEKLGEGAKQFYLEHRPAWLASDVVDAATSQEQIAGRLKDAAGVLANAAADAISEAVLVGIYLIFLLLEVGHLQQRIESGFQDERAGQILAVLGNINEAMAGYLKVKVKASLVLAIPVTLVLTAFGVKFALLFGVLTFALNFIPYIGSILACSAPILLAFLQMESAATAVWVAVILVALHSLSAYVVEPAMTGKAVGLSPLVILLSLSFWGLCWGLTGMLLAVPLTVMLKIVLEHIAFTRPVARLMGG